MGPDITNNKSGKSPYALVIYCNNNLNILIVVIMMRMTMQVLSNFMKMLTWAWYDAFVAMAEGKRVPRRRNKNGATATFSKMMPRQHIGSDSSQRYRCKRRRADVRNMLEMVGWSRLPGVPPDGGTAKEGHRKDDSITEQTMHLIQHMH